MAENSDSINLAEAATIVPIISRQNETITQLAQQITEIQKNQDLSNLAIAANAPNDGNQTSQFSSSNPIPDHAPNNLIVISTQKTSTINLTTPNQNYASSSRQALPPSQSPNIGNPQTFLPIYQNPHAACHIPVHIKPPPPQYQNAYCQVPSPIFSNVQSIHYPPNYPTPHYQNAPLNYSSPPFNYPNIESPSLNFSTPYYPNTHVNHQSQKFQILIPPYQNSLNYRHVPPRPQNNYNILRPYLEKRPPRIFTPLAGSRTHLFERLKAAGMIQTIDPKNINVNAKSYRPDEYCDYHSGGAGHTTENCINLKHKIQDLIDQKVLTLQTVAPNVDSNFLPNHEGSYYQQD